MTSRILAFSGCKQSGKSTCSNFIHGYQLRANDVIDGFSITTDGKLIVDTKMVNHQGVEERGKAFLDVGRTDAEFSGWAAYSMWPYVKRYSFASPLKEIATGLFGLSDNQVNGTDIEKNTKTPFRWEDMPGNNKRKGRMTAREFLQFFGTEVCRSIYEDVWSDRLLKSISEEGPLIAIIDDCRFPNEAKAIQDAGGKVVKLTRKPYKDSHSSESALDKYDNFDATIDNSKKDIHETNLEIISLLDEWGWLGKEITKEEVPAQILQEPELVGGIHKFRED